MNYETTLSSDDTLYGSAENERKSSRRNLILIVIALLLAAAAAAYYFMGDKAATDKAAAADANTPPFVYTGLKREQLLRTGSVVLHELYFAGLGGSGQAGSAIRSRIAAAFGSYDAWEVEFRKIAQGIAGGSGWVMLGYNESLGILENHWMADHATAPAHTRPLLVLDMYEHAFHMDYGAAAARYIDAWFANLNWETVAARA